MLVMCWEVLVTVRRSDSDVLKVNAPECSELIEKTHYFGDDVGEEMKRTFVSIDRCNMVLVYHTGWLAHCAIALDAEFVEMTLLQPNCVHHVELQNVESDTLVNTDCKHVVHILNPRSGDDTIVADATHTQYSFEKWIDTLEEYLATKVHKPKRDEQPLGTYFEKNALSGVDSWSRNKRDTIICTTKNVMVRELERIGSLEALLRMCEARFHEESKRTFALVKMEMGELGLRLERAKYGPGEGFSQGLEDLVRDYDGAGHRACERS
ncbi:hypothetical protein SVAN01_10986 [Stagonosporopsis vannaccii]|nr:hypothetical protein SVAN01_10986 [Stagonosporopsis vannaccii]